jgi:RNA polymerase subunit RPABC4/transcription elongation factor Spt4/energy-converting hydrogenase Eha subunit A
LLSVFVLIGAIASGDLFGLTLSIWALIASTLIIFFANKLNTNPLEHSKWGILITVFSILSVLGLFAIAGGIAALIYNPPPVQAKIEKPVGPSQIRVTADPTNIVADGATKSVITLQLVDENGNPIAAMADIPIKITATKGKLENPMITIPRGKDSEKAVLISSTDAGPAPVSIEPEGLKSITITLNFTGRARYCMNCGTKMEPGAKVCRNCGRAPLAGIDTKNCPNCEAVIPIAAKFCSECGAGQPV